MRARTAGLGLLLLLLAQSAQAAGGAVAATPWWHVVPGASWRAPHGPGSDVAERGANE